MWIPDAELAIARIKDRVSEGGHDVLTRDVKRRFKRSMDNFFNLYRPLLDSWMLLNNAGVIPTLIAKKIGGKVTVIDKGLFERINKQYR